MPIGALGGKANIMNNLAPDGNVYQAGTLSGNPIAMAAGLKTLEIISRKNFFKELHNKASYLLDGLKAQAKAQNFPLSIDYQGGMFGLYFNNKDKLRSYTDIKKSNLKVFIDFSQIHASKRNLFCSIYLRSGFYFRITYEKTLGPHTPKVLADLSNIIYQDNLNICNISSCWASFVKGINFV